MGQDTPFLRIAGHLDRVADALALSPDGLPQRLVTALEAEWPQLDRHLADLADRPLPAPAQEFLLALRWLLQRALDGGSYRATFATMRSEQVHAYIRDILRLRTEAAAHVGTA
jgi:hypothetical protein